MRELYGQVNQGSWTDPGKEVAQLGTEGVARITDTRTVNGNTVVASRYFVSSLKQEAREILRAVRAHWAVENTLHWSLDIAFREDESRICVGHAQQHLALVRKLALDLLRNEKTAKGSIKAKHLQAAWSDEYLLKVLGGGT